MTVRASQTHDLARGTCNSAACQVVCTGKHLMRLYNESSVYKSNSSDFVWIESRFKDFHDQQNIHTTKYDYPGFSLIGNKSVLCIVRFVTNVSNFHKHYLPTDKTIVNMFLRLANLNRRFLFLKMETQSSQ